MDQNKSDKPGNGNGRRDDGHAVVLGGGLAGMLAARVLSEHFKRVTLIERDAYLETSEVRKGIPQASHVHALLLRGRQILEKFFPGLQDEMIAAGAPLVDMANEVAWFTPAGWGVRFPSQLKALSFTRPMLDLHVRRRLMSNPRVEIRDNTEVLRLLPQAAGNRLAGVLICRRNSNSDRKMAKELRADLVIDATGRGSCAPRWLKDLGYASPEEVVVDAHLGYASRLYRIPDNFEADWKCINVQAAPPKRKRSAILFEVEDKRWLVTFTGSNRDYPPTDEPGLFDFARSLPVSTIHDAIRAAEPLTPVKTHRATKNRLRKFECVKDLPENFLLLGDSVCAVNPVYGQGMTIAALGALTLQNTLVEQRRRQPGNVNGLARRFQKRLAKINKASWLLATSEDYRYDETDGGSAGLTTKFMHRYMDHIIQLSTESAAVRVVLLRTFNMLVRPSALFHPRVLSRVLFRIVNPARNPE